MFLLVACLGIFVVRRKYSDQAPAFKVPLFPLTPLLFIAVIGWFIFKNALADKAEYYAGLLVLPIGVLLYYVFKSRRGADGITPKP